MLNQSLEATRDYFFAATYRKHDAITVPAFQQGMPGVLSPDKNINKTIKPSKVVDLRNFYYGERNRTKEALSQQLTKMSILDKLGLMFKYSFLKLRFEPENNYKMHSAVPSPRSIFPLSIILKIEAAQATDFYRYDSDNHRLIYLRSDEPLSHFSTTKVSLMLVAELDKIVPYYGDFSAYLLGLESGHLLAQLSLLSKALNLPFSFTTQVDTRELQYFKLTDKNNFKLMLSGQIAADNIKELIDDIGQQAKVEKTINNNHTDVDYQQFPLLKHYFNSFLSAATPTTFADESDEKPACTTTAYTIEQLINIHEQRTSGNDKNGLIARKNSLKSTDFNSILEKIIQLKALVFDAEFPSTRVTIYLSITSISDVKSQTLSLSDTDVGFQVVDNESPVNSLQATALSPIGAYNYDDFSCVLSFSVNLAECIQRKGNIGAQQALIAVGHLTQLCIAAMSEYSMFARPIKALDEASVESMFHAQDSIIYQLICGTKVADQMQYRMA